MLYSNFLILIATVRLQQCVPRPSAIEQVTWYGGQFFRRSNPARLRSLSCNHAKGVVRSNAPLDTVYQYRYIYQYMYSTVHVRTVTVDCSAFTFSDFGWKHRVHCHQLATDGNICSLITVKMKCNSGASIASTAALSANGFTHNLGKKRSCFQRFIETIFQKMKRPTLRNRGADEQPPEVDRVVS